MPGRPATESLKILWTCPYLPWPTVGGNRVRVFQFMRNLAARGHRITFLAQSNAEVDELVLANLTPLLDRLIVVPRRRRRHPVTLAAAAFAPYPVDVSLNGLSRRLRATMRRLLDEAWDVVQVEHGYGLQSFLGLLEQRHQPFVLTEHNVESTLVHTNDYHPRLPARLLPVLQRYDAWRYRHWERRAFKAPTRLIAVTQQDAAKMSLFAGREVDVVSNGADIDAFADVHPDAHSSRIMFIGNFAYPPNRDAVEWAAAEIMPRVWEEVPEARLVVCGSGMPGIWQDRWPDPRIEWRGFVDDICAIQRGCAMFLAPLRAGGGSKLKVLEAMAAGLPVVSTPEGVSGLQAQDGVDFLLGDDAPELAACLIRLLSDSAAVEPIGEAGRRYVVHTHGWRALTEQLETIYRSLPRTPNTGEATASPPALPNTGGATVEPPAVPNTDGATVPPPAVPKTAGVAPAPPAVPKTNAVAVALPAAGSCTVNVQSAVRVHRDEPGATAGCRRATASRP